MQTALVRLPVNFDIWSLICQLVLLVDLSNIGAFFDSCLGGLDSSTTQDGKDELTCGVCNFSCVYYSVGYHHITPNLFLFCPHSWF